MRRLVRGCLTRTSWRSSQDLVTFKDKDGDKINVRHLGNGDLQYDVDGSPRAVSRQMVIHEDTGFVHFPDINRGVWVLMDSNRIQVFKDLRVLQSSAATGEGNPVATGVGAVNEAAVNEAAAGLPSENEPAQKDEEPVEEQKRENFALEQLQRELQVLKASNSELTSRNAELTSRNAELEIQLERARPTNAQTSRRLPRLAPLQVQWDPINIRLFCL